MNTSKAKKIIANELKKLGLPPFRLTARTISFSDLARGSAIFVKINGWQPSPLWKELEELAFECGFCIESGKEQ